MIAEMNEPKSTSVFGLPLRIWKPRPWLPGTKLWMIGLMMLVVNEVIRALNARAMTSPTATTITSPRIRKFLKPLILPSPIRDSRPTGRDARPSPVFPADTPLPQLRRRAGFWTCHTIPVPGWRCKRFRPSGRALTWGSAARDSAGPCSARECRCGRGRVGGRGEQPVGPGEPDGPGVDPVPGLGRPGHQARADELARTGSGQAQGRGEDLVPGVVPEDHDALGAQLVARAAAAADPLHVVVLHGHRGHHGPADPHPLRPPEQLVHPLLPRTRREDRVHLLVRQPDQHVLLQRGAGVQPAHRRPAAVV